MGSNRYDRSEIQTDRRERCMPVITDEIVRIKRIVRFQGNAFGREIPLIERLQMCHSEITDKTFRLYLVLVIITGIEKGIIIIIFITQSQLELEIQPVHIRIAELGKMMGIAGIECFIAFLVDIQILVSELVGQVQVAQRIPFDGIIQAGKRSLPPDTPGKSQLRMVAGPVIESGIHQDADDLFRIETHTQVHRAD